MSQLKLYNYFRSSTSYRVRIALNLKELNYDYIPIHLLNNGGEQNSPSYRTLNPIGGLPTLAHGELHISQSMAICEYLEETFSSGTHLLPKTEFLRAKVRQVCEIINADLHPLQNLKVTKYLEDELKLNSDQKQKWLNRWIEDGLAATEKTISSFCGAYSFGDEVSLADAFIIPQLFSARRFNVKTDSFTNLTKIEENCQLLSSFKAAHPLRQPDTPVEIRLN
jgi:maleylacetoacetate isomerase